jgi:8-oxo-dGTP diphosphatase
MHEAIEVVAAVIVRSDGRILIARRPAGRHLAGLWEFPGGKRQMGESPEQALVREIQEELGVAVTVGAAIASVDWSYPDRRVQVVFFGCTTAGEPQAREGQQLAWVYPPDLDGYAFPPADAVLIKRLSQREP